MNELRHECLLVVEDDASLRVALERVLRKHGYGAVLTSSLREAIRGWRRHRASIRVAIVDLGLGAEDGLELIRHLHRRSPTTAIIVYSAETGPAARRELERLGVREVIAKPAAPECLVNAIRRSLDRPFGSA